jgi:hypothetical protein
VLGTAACAGRFPVPQNAEPGGSLGVAGPPAVLVPPSQLVRTGAVVAISRHLPAVQHASSLPFQGVVVQGGLLSFQPGGGGGAGGLGQAAYAMYDFPVGDLDADAIPDLEFTLDGTRSQDDGTLKGWLGVANCGRNAWDWRQLDGPVAINSWKGQASAQHVLTCCVVFIGGGIYDAQSVDLRAPGTRWPGQVVADWLTPAGKTDSTRCRWSSDPYAEDALRLFYVDTSDDSLHARHYPSVSDVFPDRWDDEAVSPAGDVVRDFDTVVISGNGFVYAAYLDSAHYLLRVLRKSSLGSTDPWQPEFQTPAGLGTMMEDSWVAIGEDLANATPAVAFRDEAAASLQYARSLPLGWTVETVFAWQPLGNHPSVGTLLGLPTCVCADAVPTGPQVWIWQFVVGLGWGSRRFDLTADPLTSMATGDMDTMLMGDGSVRLVYSCAHGLAYAEERPVSGKQPSKTFMLPHVLETSGHITRARLAQGTTGSPCVASYNPDTNEVWFSQYDSVAGQWQGERVWAGSTGEDCDDVALYIDPDDDGDGWTDVAEAIARRAPAAQPGMMKWVLEVRVQRIEMK